MNKLLNKQLIFSAFLLIGLIVAVYLVGRTTFFNPKANEVIYRSVEIKDAGGNNLDCSGGSCETKTLDIEVRLNTESLR